MTSTAIVFHDEYGRRAKQAEAVRAGAATGGTATLYSINVEGSLPDDTLEALHAADAIIVGSPTYMGRRFLSA